MAIKQIYKYLLGLLILSFFSACNSTKYVPKGSALLMKNTIYVNGKKTNAEELAEIVKQRPNKKIMLNAWKPYLRLYNWGNPEKTKGFSHWLTKIGEPPVIADSVLTLKSAKQLGIYTFKNGYFHSVNTIKTKYNKKGNKVWVSYYLYTGKPYVYNKPVYLIGSDGIEKLVMNNKSKSLIVEGAHYSEDQMEKERDRLVALFRDNGYYGFQKNLIRYEADTSAGNHTVNVKMIISDRPVYYQDSTVLVAHKPYTVKNIYVDPNYDYARKDILKDTTLYKNYYILSDTNKTFKPDLFTSSIHFNPNQVYNETKVNETYSHITGLRVFRSSQIEFIKSEKDPYELNAFIKLKPFKKRSITLEIEGTNTSGNYGIFGSVSLLNRSLFKRGEIFDFTIRGGLEAQANLQNNTELFNTYEYGLEVGITFPRFLLPAKFQEKIPKRMLPKSRISTSIGQQNRQEFQRIFFNVGLGYSWKETEKKSHQIQLIDINYLFLPYIDQSYLQSLQFVRGYDDALISATRYSFNYNSQKFGQSINRSFLLASVEFAGNILSVFDNATQFPVNDEGAGQLFGVSYAQYIKFDIDYRNYTKLQRDQQLAWRFYGGYNHTYGNTKGAPPFEKSYFAGGSNDIRGWLAYKLGPGNYPNSGYNFGDTLFYSATAPIKLMFNIEYRFTIIKAFKGAIFMDMGNIWYYNRTINNDVGELDSDLIKFKIQNIPQQIAMSPGLGIRYDFGFFVFRLDGAIKMIDPGYPDGQRFMPEKLGLNTITYNLAIGYPF